MKRFFITLALFLAFDFTWLGLVAKNFYAKHLGFLMKSNVNWLAAIGFYLLFVIGLITFVINPALEKQSLSFAIKRGALFGLITYATYDLTNLATIKNWPTLVTIVDLIWGAFLAAAVSGLSYFLIKKFSI